mmetsp:Transcript_42728/g.89703  ORF Transcript_42728/g.89703 Transcript_42728/m.89703 type:complete len:84 (+) Transcript_42728:112-363(+)
MAPISLARRMTHESDLWRGVASRSKMYRPKKLSLDFIMRAHRGEEQSLMGVSGTGSDFGFWVSAKKRTASRGRDSTMSDMTPA